MRPVGRIGILGSGSWATALAKIVLTNKERICWYFRRSDQAKAFQTSGHNPTYLQSALFDTQRIDFFADNQINNFFRACDTIILVTPSPYFKNYIKKVRKSSTKNKLFINAIKGIVPVENQLVTEYLAEEYDVPKESLFVISGPCHAEEVVQYRRSYLTVAGYDAEETEEVAKLFRNDLVSCVTSNDVVGIQYASVLKNIYAIAAGICHGMQHGDNFQSVLISNAIAEMNTFVNTVHLIKRQITNSVYLGDLLVTTYSQHSRNRTFGTLIGKGYSIASAQRDMQMVAEGYYAAKCIREINQEYQVNMPITDTIYRILYEGANVQNSILQLAKSFK